MMFITQGTHPLSPSLGKRGGLFHVINRALPLFPREGGKGWVSSLRSFLCCYLLLILASVPASARDWSVLQQVNWERDTDTNTPPAIAIHFTLKDPPNYYPVFFEENPPALRIVFSGTLLDSGLTGAASVPPPLTSFNVVEKRLAKGEPVTQIVIGIEKKCPFTTKLEKDVITLTLDVTALIRGRRMIVNRAGESEGVNRVRNILVQETAGSVEILLEMDTPAPAFSAYVLDSTPRLVVDLPGVQSDSGVAPRDVRIPPVCSLMTVTKENFTRLVFTLNRKIDVKTLQRGTRLSLILPREKTLMERNRKWVYLSASALLLGGVGGAVMMSGGSSDKPTEQSPSGDTWRTKPPNPGDIPR